MNDASETMMLEKVLIFMNSLMKLNKYTSSLKSGSTEGMDFMINSLIFSSGPCTCEPRELRLMLLTRCTNSPIIGASSRNRDRQMQMIRARVRPEASHLGK